jgi:DnaK suppressor protein
MSNGETPWEFLPDDDGDGDGDGSSAEEAAMHIQDVDDSRANDPGLTDVVIYPGANEEQSTDQFADEESEFERLTAPEDHELSLHELLEKQGYAFAEAGPDSPDETATSVGPTTEYWGRLLATERDRLVQLRHDMTSETEPTTYELDVEHSLQHRIKEEIADVDKASTRLDAGTYGQCQICHQQISDDRLRAQPAARFCINDQLKVSGGNPLT